jgi:membrane peptidoglycan carboxypeptidase
MSNGTRGDVVRRRGRDGPVGLGPELIMTEVTAQQAHSAPSAVRALVELPLTNERARKGRAKRFIFAVAALGMTGLLGWAVAREMDSSFVQSLFISRAVHDMTFGDRPGASPDIRFPKSGPYDLRLGYASLPAMIDRLSDRHFSIEHQARQSPLLMRFIRAGAYAIYYEKMQAGLNLRDRSGTSLQDARYPIAIYDSFDNIPPLIGRTLSFIEDHDLLDPDHPNRNPAIEWRRFLMAALGRFGSVFDRSLKSGGGSTLATQIEKFRHSPAGRTDNVVEKLLQMMSATARAYLDGSQTIEAQRRILTTYLNATPLSSRPGYGEVTGIGEGLLVWYGTDFAEANRALAATPPAEISVARQGEVYKQVLSLLIAERRPSYYLNLNGRGDLDTLTDSYLHRLAAAGVIEPRLRDAALAAQLRFADAPPSPPSLSFIQRKALDAVRAELMGALGVSDLYALDRLDVSADATVDAPAQERVAEALGRLGDRDVVKALGLVGDKLLGSADPGRVAYSVVLYERGADRNYVRVHADSLDEPFDINSGAKLILGSTAKLRTLGTYLGIITELHDELAQDQPAQLTRIAGSTDDPLRRWACEYLAQTSDRGLQPMLDAAMERRYSGNPGEVFFTGGAEHVFHNFERSEDSETPTVWDAFAHSINLSFVRLMRDVVRHYEAEGTESDPVAGDRPAPDRADYLHRFADEEGRVYLNRYYTEYHGLTPDEALARLSTHVHPLARRLAVVFRSVRPEASPADMHAFLNARMPAGTEFDDEDISELYDKYAPKQFGLNDRAYLAGVNPLELWLVGYLQQRPAASRSEVIAKAQSARQEAYAWLFKTHNSHGQDVRIRILREEDAFDRMLLDWRRVGYPFDHLVPSLATVIGSSGDRPEALAQLMGIILNDGLKLPTSDIQHVQFAAGTPYETAMSYQPPAPVRVMQPEVAQTIRRALMGVVANGTATRLRGIYVGDDGTPLAVGGKTGTGDNRYETFGAGHSVVESRPVDRTATFVFFLGDRFFGTVTAFVSGSEAGEYHFSSALAVSLLKALEPQLKPLINEPPAKPRVEAADTAPGNVPKPELAHFANPPIVVQRLDPPASVNPPIVTQRLEVPASVNPPIVVQRLDPPVPVIAGPVPVAAGPLPAAAGASDVPASVTLSVPPVAKPN